VNVARMSTILVSLGRSRASRIYRNLVLSIHRVSSIHRRSMVVSLQPVSKELNLWKAKKLGVVYLATTPSALEGFRNDVE